ncbi:uncharacterized protein LOC129293831 [Prosopis cineraria]|uniref:uncharacterized protein LOC129293831 n=1 Tax=Prosopis cineraria TaxID=364024 RepID=UPI00240F8CCB|nr:uncharacterized protein LOC129293831 [Prosopis cineraria]
MEPMQPYSLTTRYRGSQADRRHDGAVAAGRKTKKNVIWLGGKPRRVWRMKARPRLVGLMVGAPLKVLSKVKNAYEDLMVKLAGSVGSLNNKNVFGGKRIPKARQVTKGYSGDEFEARLILEISKVLVASNELHPK